MKLLFLLLAIPLSLQAAVICVDNDNLAATQNGSSQYPYISIQAAIANAANNDTILVAVGTYGKIDNQGKPLTILGGYQGGNSTLYNAGAGGNFSVRTIDPTLTIISGGVDSIGVNLTRFNFSPFRFVFDNFTISNSSKGIVCDQAVSWPLVENVTISNNIIENNGQPGIITIGAGVLVAGNYHQVLNNIIRNNHGGRGAGIAGNFSVYNDSLLVEGNLIENNTGYDDHGAGVYLGGYVTIKNNIISGNYLQNSYGWGGGVLILGRAYMSFNVIKNNFCPTYGGAVFVDDGATAYMDHELIYNNSTLLDGAGIAVDNSATDSSHVYLTNCTVVNNYSPGSLGGNAVYLDNISFGTLKNCIVTGNGDDFYIRSGSALTVTYTLSQEAFPGTANFTADPLFADTLNEDFHLKSIGGRYDPISLNWLIDGVHSPAIDAGDFTSTYNNEPAPHGNRINLGCYGNTIYASKSSSTADIQNITAQLFNPIVYPNPTDGIVNITVSVVGMQLVFITNILGEVVLSKEINLVAGSPFTIDLTGQPAGIYLLRLGGSTTNEGLRIILH